MMKRNLMLMLGLTSIILLAGCGGQSTKDTDETLESEIAINEENNDEDIASAHPGWTTTSLTIEDLERIEATLPPLSYNYETYDMQTQTVSDSGSYEVAEGEEPTFSIPEYENMVSREITSSGIEDNMIYTLTKITLQDGSILDVLYVNEPDTLFCRAISVQNGDKTTLYSNFVYNADIQ